MRETSFLFGSGNQVREPRFPEPLLGLRKCITNIIEYSIMFFTES